MQLANMLVVKELGIMKVIEYIGEVLPDGHLSLPDEVQKELGLGPHSSVKVTITVEDSRVLDEKKGWEAFRRLGKGATGSGLSNISVNHDQYLYRKSK
jgi:bifunctional DNA-binding transcriptional regulator/antitoxin component of YhaV-PrlF toxin-antitoxin module